MPIRILIADDHGVLRAGLCALLNAEPHLEVVAEAADGNEALRLAHTVQPDVVLMDISMPQCGGIEATRQIKELSPEVGVLILTLHEDHGLLREAIRAGAAGYILKRAAGSELVNAIQAVSRGEMYVHPGMTRALLEGTTPMRADTQVAIETLTPREVEVLRLIAQGYTNRQMADLLTLSVRTIESYRARLMEKLDLHSRVELVRYAAQHGLSQPGEA